MPLRDAIRAGAVTIVVVTGALEVQAAEAEPAAASRHFRIERPAELDDADAGSIYRRILPAMTGGYAMSGNPVAEAYAQWRRFSASPYHSSQHGERFVNNYGNGLAAAYGRFDDAVVLPPGAVLVKDSFTVTAQGDVHSGPLFIMTKEPAGFSPASNDWRYTMIMPDGSLYGTTGGEGAARVRFCIGCHAAASVDHLFFIPQRHRLDAARRQ